MRDAAVLLATNTFGRLGEVNGVAHTCQRLASEFRDAGVPLEVVTYGDRPAVETDGSLTIRVHRPDPGIEIDPSLRIDPLFRLSRTATELSRRSYSIVHSTTPDPLGRFAMDIAKARRIPFVAGYHTAVDRYAAMRVGDMFGPLAGQIAGSIMRSYLFNYYSQADLILVPSRATGMEIRDWTSAPIEVVGRGVDHDLFNPSKRTRCDEKVRALYVGRVAIEKGIDRLIPIFAERRDVSLTVVGDGPWLREMKRLLPDACYTGVLRGEALAQQYADADLFVFPSVTDTFGNVVLEAMSSGLPVIVTDRGGPAQQIRHDADGFITRSDAELGAIVNLLVRDPKLRARVGAEARRSAEQRSWQMIFRDLLDQYDKVRSSEPRRLRPAA